MLTLVGLAAMRRRRPQRLAHADSTGKAGGGKAGGGASSSEGGSGSPWGLSTPQGSSAVPDGKQTPTVSSWTPPSSVAAAQAAGQAPGGPQPDNPFAAGAPSARASRKGSGLATTWPTPGSSRLQLSDATGQLTAGGGSGSSTLTPEQRSKLAALQAEAPSWLISHTRLSLDQGTNGQLVLLGRGGCAGGGWLAGWAWPASKPAGDRGSERPLCAAAPPIDSCPTCVPSLLHCSFGRVYRGYLDLPAGLAGQSLSTLSASLASDSTDDTSGGPVVQLPVAIKVLDNADIPAFVKEAGESGSAGVLGSHLR